MINFNLRGEVSIYSGTKDCGELVLKKSNVISKEVFEDQFVNFSDLAVGPNSVNSVFLNPNIALSNHTYGAISIDNASTLFGTVAVLTNVTVNYANILAAPQYYIEYVAELPAAPLGSTISFRNVALTTETAVGTGTISCLSISNLGQLIEPTPNTPLTITYRVYFDSNAESRVNTYFFISDRETNPSKASFAGFGLDGTWLNGTPGWSITKDTSKTDSYKFKLQADYNGTSATNIGPHYKLNLGRFSLIDGSTEIDLPPLFSPTIETNFWSQVYSNSGTARPFASTITPLTNPRFSGGTPTKKLDIWEVILKTDKNYLIYKYSGAVSSEVFIPNQALVGVETKLNLNSYWSLGGPSLLSAGATNITVLEKHQRIIFDSSFIIPSGDYIIYQYDYRQRLTTPLSIGGSFLKDLFPELPNGGYTLSNMRFEYSAFEDICLIYTKLSTTTVRVILWDVSSDTYIVRDLTTATGGYDVSFFGSLSNFTIVLIDSEGLKTLTESTPLTLIASQLSIAGENFTASENQIIRLYASPSSGVISIYNYNSAGMPPKDRVILYNLNTTTRLTNVWVNGYLSQPIWYEEYSTVLYHNRGTTLRLASWKNNTIITSTYTATHESTPTLDFSISYKDRVLFMYEKVLTVTEHQQGLPSIYKPDWLSKVASRQLPSLVESAQVANEVGSFSSSDFYYLGQGAFLNLSGFVTYCMAHYIDPVTGNGTSLSSNSTEIAFRNPLLYTHYGYNSLTGKWEEKQWKYIFDFNNNLNTGWTDLTPALLPLAIHNNSIAVDGGPNIKWVGDLNSSVTENRNYHQANTEGILLEPNTPISIPIDLFYRKAVDFTLTGRCGTSYETIGTGGPTLLNSFPNLFSIDAENVRLTRVIIEGYETEAVVRNDGGTGPNMCSIRTPDEIKFNSVDNNKNYTIYGVYLEEF